jgi:hypothetical protein
LTYGTKPAMGLSHYGLPKEVEQAIDTEEQLEEATGKQWQCQFEEEEPEDFSEESCADNNVENVDDLAFVL